MFGPFSFNAFDDFIRSKVKYYRSCTIDDIIFIFYVSLGLCIRMAFSTEFNSYFTEREIDTLGIVLNIDYACLELFNRQRSTCSGV